MRQLFFTDCYLHLLIIQQSIKYVFLIFFEILYKTNKI